MFASRFQQRSSGRFLRSSLGPSLGRSLRVTLCVPVFAISLAACTSDAKDEAPSSDAPSSEVSASDATETAVASSAPSDAVSSDAGNAVTAATEVAVIDGGALKGKTVVYLINGALGDKGFYDSGQAGIDKLKEKYGVSTRTLEANFDAAKYQALVDAAFEEGDVVFAIAYGFEDALKAAAKAHPDKPVINLDFDIKDADKHVTSVDFVEEESAFLAGVIAAQLTVQTSTKGINPEPKIGIVLGDTDPVTSSFAFAYENGAKYINKSVVVEQKSLGGAWDDQAKGKQAAEQLFDGGSDVIFQVAAAAGLGVLQSAKDRSLYAIGVDANQNDLYPGAVVASDLKNVGGTIEKIANTIASGSYKAGEVLTYGIAQGGVDIVTDAKTPVLTDAMVVQEFEIRKKIASGQLKIERYKAK
jgi:basic membrane protein A and related proteins